MGSVPEEFRARIAEHNRHCWLAAGASLLGAWLAWVLFFALYSGAVLVFETIRTGNTDLFKPPFWYGPVGIAGCVLILVSAAIERWKKRYRPVSDRPIIGWHLAPEVLMLPAQMTYAVWDHIDARIRLSRLETEEAWRLLQTVAGLGRASIGALGQEIADPRALTKLLLALQLSGWIDLHQGEEDWFYRVRSTEEEALRSLTLPEPQEES